MRDTIPVSRDAHLAPRIMCSLLKNKIMIRCVNITIALMLLALVAGCGSSPMSRFYRLSADAAPGATASSLSVVVGPVSIPAIVDRPQIVVSTGPNQVRLDEFNRWASPLQGDIARVVAENLTAMLGTPQVTLSTLSADGSYRAVIEVQRFDSI